MNFTGEDLTKLRGDMPQREFGELTGYRYEQIGKFERGDLPMPRRAQLLFFLIKSKGLKFVKRYAC